MYTHRIFREDTGHAMYVTPLVNASYIPLSHSTDRMRIWETLQNGVFRKKNILNLVRWPSWFL